MTGIDIGAPGQAGEGATAGPIGGAQLPEGADVGRQLAEALAGDDDAPEPGGEPKNGSADVRGQGSAIVADARQAVTFVSGRDTPEIRAVARKAMERYLRTLDPNAAHYDIRAFDDREGREGGKLRPETFYRVTLATMETWWPKLWRLNQRGYGIFVTVNATYGKGAKGANVIRVRAVIADCDGVDPSALVAAKTPHMAVSSSSGKWHLYWLTSDCSREMFTPLHKALIGKYGTDKPVHDLPRVLRLPGFHHNKATPCPVMFDYKLAPKADMELSPYTVAEIIAGLGLDIHAAAARSEAAGDASSRGSQEAAQPVAGATGTTTRSLFDFTGPEAVSDALRKLPPPPDTRDWVEWVEGALAKLDPDCDRDLWRDIIWGLVATGWDETAKRLLRAWSALAKKEENRGQVGLEELLKSFDPTRGITFGTFVRSAREAGYTKPLPGRADASVGADGAGQAADATAIGTTAAGDVDATYEGTDLTALRGPSDDTWNGRRFARHWRGRLRYIPEQNERNGFWLVFDPACGWRVADFGEVERAAIDSVEVMVSEVSRLVARHGGNAEHPDVKRLSAQLKYSRKGVALRELVRVARTLPGMSARKSDFDGDPMHLGVANGVLDLATGALLPVTPDLMVRLRCGVAFDPAATCPTFERFLIRMQPDPEQRAFLRRWLFYCLTGRFAEKKFLFHHGPDGNNGKSTLLEVFASMVGDYARKIATESLMEHKRNAQSHDADLAVIRNKRFLFASETRPGQRLSSDRIKDLTGGDTVVARRPHEKEALQLKPTYKLQMYGNHLPSIDDPSRAMWSRVLVLDWNVVISEADIDFDPDLRAKLLAEAPGLMTWVLGARAEYLERGLAAPPGVLAAAESYRKEENTIAAFVAEKCRAGEGLSADKDRLYDAFVTWWKGQGHTSEPGTNKLFTRRMGKEGFPLMPDKRRIGGLALSSDPSISGIVSPLRAA